MNILLQYLALILSVLAIVGLIAIGLLWNRLTSLLQQLIRLNLQIIPLLKDMPKFMHILSRLELAAEASRLSDDLLSVGVDKLAEAAHGVATDLRDSHARADKIIGNPGEAADAAAQFSVKEIEELTEEAKEITEEAKESKI